MATENPADGGGLAEADRHGCVNPAVRPDAVDGWADVPRVSTCEVVWALRHLGVGARLAGPDHVVVLHHGVEVALVPLKDRLHPGLVLALLHTLGISLDRLVEYLAVREG